MKKIPAVLFALSVYALISCVSAAAQTSYRPSSGDYSGGYTPPPPNTYSPYPSQPQSNEWVACVFNQADRPRPIQVIWHGQRGIKERCTETMTVQPGDSAVFRCRFMRSVPKTQLVATGLRSGRILVNSWINSGVRDGRRQCGRSNSSTIVGQGRDLQVINGKPEYRRYDHRSYPRR